MQSFRFAEPYDIMAHRLFPYNGLAAHLSTRLGHYRDSVQTILDVACGTGNLTIPLAQLGYQSIGLDISPDMLALARQKAETAGLEIPFVCQDMRQPHVGEQVDAIVCFYDGLNFLTSPEAVRQALAAFYTALAPGGLLAFDQFIPARMRAEFSGLKAADFGSFYVITRSRCDSSGQIVHQVTYFIKNGDSYRREEELQHMRIHPFPELAQSLLMAGFNLLAVEALYPQVNADALQDSVLFVAQKPSCATS